jgi:hypothetical protein
MKKINRLLLLSSCATTIGGAGVLALAKGDLRDHSEIRSVAGDGGTIS